MASADKPRGDTPAGSERSRPRQPDRRESTAGSPAAGSAAGSRQEQQQERGGVRTARRSGASVRSERYLVASTAWTDGQALARTLEADPEIAVLRTFRAANSATVPRIAVIETSAERAAALARQPQMYVEADQALGWSMPAGAVPGVGTDVLMAPVGDLEQIRVHVKDDSGRPVDGASVWVFGGGVPAAGVTGPDGWAELPVAAETAAMMTEIRVRPPRGCWPTRVTRPRVMAGNSVTVACERITKTFADFPDRALLSWGAQAMGFSRLPPTHRGAGVRIAIADSGAASGHPDLAGRLADGRDVVGEDDKTWQNDRIGTGTHLAVLLAGQDDGTGVVGLAPETEIHVLRTAPGGHCADLIEALDYCIDQEIDIALLSSGFTGDSWLLAGRVAEARNHGVACIAAAGDGSGPVGLPAALPGVLAVGAIGRLGTFPPDSGLATQLTGPPTQDGFFAPRFTSRGPGIDCCAPGVAIVSGLPPASYGPMSGTATAAGHIAAVAALVLAHHPQFAWPGAGPSAPRDASRVDRLFQIILAACRPLPELGSARVGAGLPDAGVAIGVAPWGNFATLPQGAAPGAAASGPGPAGTNGTLTALEAAMRSAGLLPRAL